MEKEKFDYQGKSPEQIKDSYKIAGYTFGIGIFDWVVIDWVKVNRKTFKK